MTRTNAAGILTVLLRAAGVFMLARTLIALPATLSSLREAGYMGEQLWPTVLASILVIVVAVVLWLFADVLSRLTLARPGQPPFESDISFAQWQELAIRILGLYIAVEGLLEFTYGALLTYYLARREMVVADAYSLMRNGAVLGAIQAFIGLSLFLGARGLTGWVQRLRGRDTQATGDGSGQ
jgi:hypothetical protein